MTFIITEGLQTELSCLVKLLSDKHIQNQGKMFSLSVDSASMSSFGIMFSPTCLYTITLLLNSMHKILCPPIFCVAIDQPAKEFIEAVGILVGRREGSIPLIHHPRLHIVSNPANRNGRAGVQYEKHRKGG
jgi:hypothetical protein